MLLQILLIFKDETKEKEVQKKFLYDSFEVKKKKVYTVYIIPINDVWNNLF